LQATLRYARALIATGKATPALHSAYLYILLYSPQSTRSSIRQACEAFGRALTPVRRSEWPRNGTDDLHRRLRIGYLTGEFTRGPAFCFLPSLLGNHDHNVVEVFCYHVRDVFHPETAWYQSVGNWRDCRALSNREIAAQIRIDEIDILVDLSAFFPENKLGIFANRAAPVQVTYPNCPTTTGIGNMDYILTDRWTCPAGYEDQYTEQPYFLPSGYLVYTPPASIPEVRPLPALGTGRITFGMFQRRAKFNTAVWDAVGDILCRCPTSELVLLTGEEAIDDPSSAACLETRMQLANRQIGEHRVRLIGKRTQPETVDVMSDVDIALDTFPYQGQTTTCECLWLGIPVVTRSGEPHVARVGTALLERAGLGEWVSSTPAGYVDTAVRLASDIPALAQLRAGLRERVRRSTLLDGRRLASEVESAYRWMWKRWLTKEGQE
jgi:predicted O-linked N-acetylglucosamine transferase (SPINDLY family)